MSVYFRTRYIKSVQLKPSSKYSDTVVALMMAMGWVVWVLFHSVIITPTVFMVRRIASIGYCSKHHNY